MKYKKIKEVQEILVVKCPYCKREIRAREEKALKYNLEKHIEFKHKGEKDGN